MVAKRLLSDRCTGDWSTHGFGERPKGWHYNGWCEVARLLIWAGIGLGTLLLVAVVGLSVLAGGPKDAMYMVRYALPHMHRGNLKLGDNAPAARRFALDGSDTFHIRERSNGKPLVLIFGSFT